MVYQPTQSSEITKPKHKKVFYVFSDLLVLLIVAAATFFFLRLTFIRPENREHNNIGNHVSAETLDGQGWMNRAITGWFDTIKNNSEASIEVYDLDNNSKLGGVFVDRLFLNQPDSVFETTFSTSEKLDTERSADKMIELIKVAFEHVDMSDEDWNTFKQSLVPAVPEDCQDECVINETGLAAGFSSEISKIYNENYTLVENDTIESYRDMALVEMTTESGAVRSFAIAVFGRNFDSTDDFKTLGEILEKVISAHLDEEQNDQ